MTKHPVASNIVRVVWPLCLCCSGCAPAGSSPTDLAATNLAPEADDQAVTVSFNTPKAITLTASDPDDGPQALTFSIESPPEHGALTGAPPEVTYTPDSGYTGTDSFTFMAQDGAADSNTATVSLTVLAAGSLDGDDTPGVPFPFTTYRGTYQLTWRLEVPGLATETGEASGVLEFGAPIDIAQLYQQYGAGTAFSVTTANTTAGVADWRQTYANGVICDQTGGGLQGSVPWGWLYILNSPREVGFELNVESTITKYCVPPPPGVGMTIEGVAAGFFCGGGCPPVFVAAGLDNGTLEGDASYTCTTAAGSTQTATLSWQLTGS
ncbi:MAG: Ig-like domain-containing protein [Planctomycetes bacterium]|nr:Ig-like domain-containing protein [Planctomycetota bacterium]